MAITVLGASGLSYCGKQTLHLMGADGKTIPAGQEGPRQHGRRHPRAHQVQAFPHVRRSLLQAVPGSGPRPHGACEEAQGLLFHPLNSAGGRPGQPQGSERLCCHVNESGLLAPERAIVGSGLNGSAAEGLTYRSSIEAKVTQVISGTLISAPR